jgi:NAD(P)-dependent dehydrogenase (short-subunit alcohol dehydrogenase family)
MSTAVAARSAWSETAIPDQRGRTAVVTGASSGIGLETARGLAARGAHVVLAVRSAERGHAALSAILAGNPRASLELAELDLANLTSVHRFADVLERRHGTVALLVNNAGVSSPTLERTADGFELLLGTNYLGHFALTGRLLPALLRVRRARVVTVASLAHARGRIDFENLDGAMGYAPARAYAQSKLAGVLFAYELERRLTRAGADAISVACHPGWAFTNLAVGPSRPNPGLAAQLLSQMTRRFAPSARAGAQPSLYAATSFEVRGGDYVGPSGLFGVWGRPGRVRSSALSYDQDVAGRLWKVSESLTGVPYDALDDRDVRVSSEVRPPSRTGEPRGLLR